MIFLRKIFSHHLAPISYLLVFFLLCDFCNIDTLVPGASRVSIDESGFLAIIDYHQTVSFYPDLDANQGNPDLESEPESHRIKVSDLDSGFYIQYAPHLHQGLDLHFDENKPVPTETIFSSDLYLKNCCFLN